MTETYRICDLCNEKMSGYIPFVQILGKPKGGWRQSQYVSFNDICEKCHDEIMETIIKLIQPDAFFPVKKIDKNKQKWKKGITHDKNGRYLCNGNEPQHVIFNANQQIEGDRI